MASNLSGTVSISMKLNLGNYESADVFMSVGGITNETTAEEVDAILDGPASFTYERVRERLRARLQEIREKRNK